MSVAFVVGSSRGIGVDLVEQLVSKHDYFVYAGVRNIEKIKGCKGC